MVDVPYDIWEAIANNIEEKELLKLASVHPAFLNIALDIRFREIWWIKLDEPMVSKLGILQDPSFARRVKHLHIGAWFLELLFKQDTAIRLVTEGTTQKRVADLWAWVLTMGRLKPRLPKPSEKSHTISLKKRLGTLSSPRELVSAMAAAIESMVNVAECDFEWRDLPLNDDTRVLLSTACTTFDTTLTKLVLSATISKLAKILAIVNFKKLEELELNFEYDSPRIANADDPSTTTLNQDILASRVAPFINHLGPSLQSLKISSSAQRDHSHFFHALSSLPNLRVIAVRMPFGRKHLADSTGLFQMIKIHSSTLRTLELHRTDVGMKASRSDITRHIEQQIMDVSPHMQLESLSIPSLSQEMTIFVIKMTVGTLTHLSLSDRFLTIDEVVQIIDIFTTAGSISRMTHLSLKVQGMPPRLLDILTKGFPALLSLTLVVAQDSTDLQRDEAESPFIDDTSIGNSPMSLYITEIKGTTQLQSYLSLQTKRRQRLHRGR